MTFHEATNNIAACVLLLGIYGHSDAKTPTSEFRGVVMAVNDGDTIAVLHPVDGYTKVRLTDIDAPEIGHGASRPGQPFGQASKRALTHLVLAKTASFQCYDGDVYDRLVCRVRVGQVDAGEELTKQGLAWANKSNPRYVRDKQIHQVEGVARQAGNGLWSDPKSVAPWVWRKECWKGQVCPSGVDQ